MKRKVKASNAQVVVNDIESDINRVAKDDKTSSMWRKVDDIQQIGVARDSDNGETGGFSFIGYKASKDLGFDPKVITKNSRLQKALESAQKTKFILAK